MWWWLAVIGALCLGAGSVMGAPYLPILKRQYEPLLDLAGLKPGDTIIDLGSGDGRLLLAAARQGATCIGYEINPVMYLVSLIVCWPQRRRIRIHLGDYWRTQLPPA